MTIGKKIFYTFFGFIVFVGIILNLIIFICLKVKSLPSQYTTVVLRNQAFIDCFVCFLTFLFVVLPEQIITKNLFFDLFFCHIWNGQAIYWWMVLAGVFNLIFTAFDRYWAIITPLSYGNNLKKKVKLSYLIIYLVSGIITIPAMFQTSLKNHTCESTYAFEGDAVTAFYKGFSIVWFLSIYGIPATIMIYLYSRIVFNIRRNVNAKRKFTFKTITKAAIIITIVFLVTIAYDAIYYMLGYFKVISYEFGTPIQLLGVFLTSFNSCINPVVLFIIVRNIRIRCYKLLGIIFRNNFTIVESSGSF
uniref:GCR160 n=1 Tax=Schmidtea mediterranea TaxID=79327 RepID=A0A193KUV5_SCHMD|nr:GCR160 [Schmidtea mediterranea]